MIKIVIYYSIYNFNEGKLNKGLKYAGANSSIVVN
jgi:hypothetical protein